MHIYLRCYNIIDQRDKVGGPKVNGFHEPDI